MSAYTNPTIYAFIDAQNLNLGTSTNIADSTGRNIYQGWKLDFAKLRIYLKDKYQVSKAFLFIGYLPGNIVLYTRLKEAGYICIFKEVLQYKSGTIKGNVDAKLVLQAMIEWQNYQQAVIITGDGDFHCLIKHLARHQKLKAILIPNRIRFSALLKRTELNSYLRYLNDLQSRLERKRP